ncbi:FAD:protein FMN transferase [Thalassorhabdomicrobium marinisediminis]|uniref:FAD:protein FMN transferase n=1 Tax=Thalassorhabdomicrobium marinisediminis TaxID=2170577 RepID=A0A2T7FZ07_9RHOB|nr:FAD:protein FMN transferase [Thalassorhabdomicrobium marinisediminis]PVA07407.1 thiamine biosynthesis protein ApbE [Thalassorhabdomicrobium marinisediminis]
MTTRRRFLTISAAAAMLPHRALAQPIHTWQGIALGARATLRLAHPDAAAISQRVADEIDRLEDIFSLYRAQSDLSRLNRDGRLDTPPFELLECLSLARSVHAASGGRFDPTVQPLWAIYAEASAAGRVPQARAIAERAVRVGLSRVTFDAMSIRLEPGMALTLNGIAQGYIADRIADMLSAAGLKDILIDTGEFRAVRGHPDGHPWPVQLAAGGTVPLADRALATSAPLGTTFDEDATVGHILHPETGRPTTLNWSEVSISAPTAALADSLSTAACLLDTRRDIDALVAQFTGARVEATVPA